MSIGLYIAQSREKAHLSRHDLAKRCGVSRIHVYAIETGKNAPSLPLCESLVQALGLDRDETLLMAGHVPEDILKLLQREPEKACKLIRGALSRS